MVEKYIAKIKAREKQNRQLARVAKLKAKRNGKK